MKSKKYRLGIIPILIIASVIIISTIIVYQFVRLNSLRSQPVVTAIIGLERVEFNETIEVEYVEIMESDFEQYPLLAEVLDAWGNTDKYENAYMEDNNTLRYDTTSREAENLYIFIEEKLYQKYSGYVHPPYYINYNGEFYRFSIGEE